MANILAIDDDHDLCALLKTALERDGHTVETRTSGTQLTDTLCRWADCILLDVMMPGEDGFAVCRRIRAETDAPILFLTARTDEPSVLTGLGLGADDYLTKPFSVEELLARLRVALRRVRYDTSRAGDQASIYENGELRIDYAAGCVYRGGTEIHLTPIEYKLICVLAKNTGKVLTHNYLLNEVWGSPAASDTPSLRVFMATLRKKIEEDPSHPRYIQTHIGVGYRMIRQ